MKLFDVPTAALPIIIGAKIHIVCNDILKIKQTDDSVEFHEEEKRKDIFCPKDRISLVCLCDVNRILSGCQQL
jgi:hypothetical protein